LTQSRIDPPVTADRAERRSSRKRRFPLALVLAPVVLVAAGVVALLVLGGGGDGPLGGIIGGGDDVSDATPPFEFRVGRTGVVATVADADVAALKTEAEALVPDIVPVLDDLYTNAFLDPTNWRENDYEEIGPLFSDEAASSVPSNLETLTLGTTAGDVFDTVTPEQGKLGFRVLFDQEGNPHTVVARVRFEALGARQDGTYVSIVSIGELFLRNVDGWRVTAYDVRRADGEAEPPPSPSPSGSAGATGEAR
jgi:hypothetical protein